MHLLHPQIFINLINAQDFILNKTRKRGELNFVCWQNSHACLDTRLNTAEYNLCCLQHLWYESVIGNGVAIPASFVAKSGHFPAYVVKSEQQQIKRLSGMVSVDGNAPLLVSSSSTARPLSPLSKHSGGQFHRAEARRPQLQHIRTTLRLQKWFAPVHLDPTKLTLLITFDLSRFFTVYV